MKYNVEEKFVNFLDCLRNQVNVELFITLMANLPKDESIYQIGVNIDNGFENIPPFYIYSNEILRNMNRLKGFL